MINDALVFGAQKVQSASQNRV